MPFCDPALFAYRHLARFSGNLCGLVGGHFKYLSFFIFGIWENQNISDIFDSRASNHGSGLIRVILTKVGVFLLSLVEMAAERVGGLFGGWVGLLIYELVGWWFFIFYF